MDKNAFGELVMEAELSLYRVAKSILQSDDDCADAIGEAVTKAFERLHTLREDRYAKTWLMRILINECFSIRRYAQRYIYPGEEQELETMVESQGNETAADYSTLYEAIARLPAKNRLVIVLYYLEGYSVREIADLLHIKENAVKTRMSRARKEMKRILKEDQAWTILI
ncbi:MAG: sigma-70 family RNA polymerase sigma factor [Alistipes sp.]|nr:sigma-70 family RNA polymerase sigma factor [Alistipes sp.]